MFKKKLIAAVAVALAMSCTFSLAACSSCSSDEEATNDDIVKKIESVETKLTEVETKVNGVETKVNGVADEVVEKINAEEETTRITTRTFSTLSMQDAYVTPTASETAYTASKVELDGFAVDTSINYEINGNSIGGIIVFKNTGSNLSDDDTEYKYYSTEKGEVILERKKSETFGVVGVRMDSGYSEVNVLIKCQPDNVSNPTYFTCTVYNMDGNVLTEYKKAYNESNSYCCDDGNYPSVSYPYDKTNGIKVYTIADANNSIILNGVTYSVKNFKGVGYSDKNGIVVTDAYAFGYEGTFVEDGVGSHTYNGSYYCTDKACGGKISYGKLTVYSVTEGIVREVVAECDLSEYDGYNYHMLSDGNILIQGFTKAEEDCDVEVSYSSVMRSYTNGSYWDFESFIFNIKNKTKTSVNLDFLLNDPDSWNTEEANGIIFYSNVDGGEYDGVFDKTNVKNVASVYTIEDGVACDNNDVCIVAFDDDCTDIKKLTTVENGDDVKLITPTYGGKYTDGSYLYSYENNEYKTSGYINEKTGDEQLIRNEQFFVVGDRLYDYNLTEVYDLSENGMNIVALTETGVVLKGVADGKYYLYTGGNEATALGDSTSFEELSILGGGGSDGNYDNYRCYDVKTTDSSSSSEVTTRTIKDYAGNTLVTFNNVSSFVRMFDGVFYVTYTDSNGSAVTECYVIAPAA